jgi:hypothetical protein
MGSDELRVLFICDEPDGGHQRTTHRVRHERRDTPRCTEDDRQSLALEARLGSRIHRPRPGRRQWERAEWGRSGEPAPPEGGWGPRTSVSSVLHAARVQRAQHGRRGSRVPRGDHQRAFQDAPGRYQAGPCRRQRQQRSVIASFRWFTSGVQAQGDGADPCSFSYPRRPRRQGFRAPGFRPPIRQFDHSQEHPPLAGGL